MLSPSSIREGFLKAPDKEKFYNSLGDLEQKRASKLLIAVKIKGRTANYSILEVIKSLKKNEDIEIIGSVKLEPQIKKVEEAKIVLEESVVLKDEIIITGNPTKFQNSEETFKDEIEEVKETPVKVSIPKSTKKKK